MRAPRVVGSVAALATVLLLLPTAGAGPVALGTHPLVRWSLQSPSNAPAPRNYVQMAYDAHDGYVVEYGGYNPICNCASGSVLYNDTWEYRAGAWTELHPSTHPSAPTGLVLAYDPALHGVLAFGGSAPYGARYYAQTWLFSAGNWTRLAPKHSPSARAAYAMTYDAFDHEMVLFGGTNSTSSALSDTWVFNGATWSIVPTTSGPPGRSTGSLVYDPASHETLLVGGYAGGVKLSGTWAFRSGNWTFLPHSDTPLRNLAYVGQLGNGTPVLFGGEVPGQPTLKYHATYEFYGLAWHLARPHGFSMPALANGGITYDAHDGYTLVFGGADARLDVNNATYALR